MHSNEEKQREQQLRTANGDQDVRLPARLDKVEADEKQHAKRDVKPDTKLDLNSRFI